MAKTPMDEAGGVDTEDRYRQKSRKGLKAVMTWQPPAVAKQLKQLAAEKDMTVSKLIAEGLNLMFEHYGKPPIAS
jgi:hypothetical protein